MILKTIFSVAVVFATAGDALAVLASSSEYVMGTVAEIRIHDARDGAQGARAALEAAFAEIRAIDRLMAVQRPDSEVSRLNREAATHAVRVDPRVIEVLEASVAASRLTGGAFDVTVLPVVRAWGFTDGRPARPAAGAPATIAGWRSLALDPEHGTVAYRSLETAIDVGGIGKGYALDRARDRLHAHGVRSAWLDLGGQIATVGRPPDAPRWRIGIRHPRRAGALLGVVEIGEASVSTSGDDMQFAVADGRRWSHVIDPRTALPVTDMASATVIGASATMVDALSTAAVVLGQTRAARALAEAKVDGVFARVDDGGALTVTTTPGAPFAASPTDASNPEHP
jgi:thiamine biosynthesis lipoprotein ApbE